MLTPRKIQSRPLRRKEPSYVRESHPQALKPATVHSTYGGTTGAAVPKSEKAKPRGEQAHKAALAGLGCMACLRIHGPHTPGPVELHHLRGGGWGKGDYTTLIPLCVEHHRGKTGVHGMGTKAFPAFHGFSQADLLEDALTLIGATT